jgi:transposase
MTSIEGAGEDIARLQRQLAEERAARAAAEDRAREAVARATSAEALIAHLRLAIEKLRRSLYGSRSEHGHKLLEDLVATAAEEAAGIALAGKGETVVRPQTRRQPVRQPLPEHLARERVVVPGPSACPCCGSSKLTKLGEDVTETLEVIPRQWKVIQYVREKFSCRACETISQAPAPFHVISRGRAGANLLAMVLYGKFGLHQPLNRQSADYAKEGIDLPLSTLADHVGACAAVLQPLVDVIGAHVFAGERVHGDETPVPLLAKGKCRQARLWTYVRDDRPFGGHDPPAAVYYFSRDRTGANAERHLAGYGGILQADCYGGYNGLYRSDRRPRPITEAACWAHARRKFFVLADIAAQARDRKKPIVISPIAHEAVQRMDDIFALERAINGHAPDRRLEARRETVALRVKDLIDWMTAERAKLSANNDVAKAMNYMLTRIEAFTGFLHDGRMCLTNNAAERSLRGIALGRKAWLFAGSERGGERAAAMFTLIETAKLNGIDPQAWLADVLARIADHRITDLAALLPWNWRPRQVGAAAA